MMFWVDSRRLFSFRLGFDIKYSYNIILVLYKTLISALPNIYEKIIKIDQAVLEELEQILWNEIFIILLADQRNFVCISFYARFLFGLSVILTILS